MRYFLEFSYDGSAYHGWQIQVNAITVQEVIQKALSTLLRNDIEVIGAGRTDTGVHALHMFCHFDTPESIPDLSSFTYHLNALLPKDIAAKKIREVNEKAHARFDAISRKYVYRIIQQKEAFLVNRAWLYPYSLDLNAMNEASERLKTFSDFSCFSKSGTQTKTNICKVTEATWIMQGSEIVFNIRADRFLRNMVRAIVGTMIDVGRGDMDLAAFEQVIKSGKRSEAGISVPAHALYLAEVEYPSNTFKS
jgi:tRNA pseudouridine38-40 synthase